MVDENIIICFLFPVLLLNLRIINLKYLIMFIVLGCLLIVFLLLRKFADDPTLKKIALYAIYIDLGLMGIILLLIILMSVIMVVS